MKKQTRDRAAVVRRRVGALVLLPAVLLTGCATDGVTDTGPEEPEKPLAIENRIDVSVDWAREAGADGFERYAKLAPAFARGQIFAAFDDGGVASYKADDGEPVWTVETKLSFAGGPAVSGDMVLLGTRNADVVTLNAGDGKTLWRTTVSSEVLSPPAAGKGMVVVQTVDGKIFGLRASDGERVWVYDRAVPILTLRGTGVPVIVGDLVVSGLSSGRVVALSLRDGSLVWDTSIAVPRGRSELERMVDIDIQPVVVDGVVYAVAYQGRVSALNLATGEVLWNREMSSHLGLAVQGRYVYLTDSNGNVWALDRQSGATVWMQSRLRGRATTRPAVTEDYLVVGSITGALYWLAPEDGRLLAVLPVETVDDNLAGGRMENRFGEQDELVEEIGRAEPIVSSAPVINGNNLFVGYLNGIVAGVRFGGGR